MMIQLSRWMTRWGGESWMESLFFANRKVRSHDREAHHVLSLDPEDRRHHLHVCRRRPRHPRHLSLPGRCEFSFFFDPRVTHMPKNKQSNGEAKPGRLCPARGGGGLVH